MDSAIDPTVRQSDDDNKNATDLASSSALGGRGQTIEDDVKQLAGSISSWWSDFSRKSQQQINDVRAQIDAQGGIVTMAKREAAKFEAQLSDAQETARKNVNVDDAARKRQSVDLDGWGVAGSAIAAGDVDATTSVKGKGKEGEGDDGAAVERLEERTRQRLDRNSGEVQTQSTDLASSTGEALFDADAPDRNTGGGESKAIEDVAQSAMTSMQSFWDRIQSDPTVSKLQTSVAKTLQDIKLPGQASVGEGATGDGSTQSKQAKSALPDLSEQFQRAFPSLDWKESQAMAKRYFEVSQTAAMDWTKEMGTLVSDLVHIVPPEGEGGEQKGAASNLASDDRKKEVASVPAYAAAPAFTEEDDFDWDKEVEAGSIDGLETTTGPQTASWDDDPHMEQVQTVSEAEEASERGKATPAAPQIHAGRKNDEDEDSDWE